MVFCQKYHCIFANNHLNYAIKLIIVCPLSKGKQLCLSKNS